MSTEQTTTQCQLKIGKCNVDVDFDSTNGILKWTPCDTKKRNNITEVSVTDIIRSDALGTSWSVLYVKKTTVKWSECKVEFTGEESECQRWGDDITAAVMAATPERPKRLLVFINPDGGKKSGVKDYKKYSAPLFEKAGVTTEVIVTEDGEHSKRVLADYDLAKIDGLIGVGGDGTYMRLVNALQWRLMKDAGKDDSDLEAEFVVPDIPIGILPGGTGQGMIKCCTLIDPVDYPTATFFIILGSTMRTSMMSVYAKNKLLCHAALHLMYGMFGDVIATSEAYRHLGRFRYLYAIVKHLWKPRLFDMKIEYCQHGDESKEWSSLSGRYILANAMLYRCEEKGKNAFLQGPFTIYTLNASVGRMGLLNHFRKLATRDDQTFTMDGLTEKAVEAIKFELPALPENASDQHVLNIDGEAYFEGPGEILIRLREKHIKLFGRLLQ